MEEENKEEQKPITHFVQPDDITIQVKWEFQINKTED